MLQVQSNIQSAPRLQRGPWHKPLVSIIITHFNYSSHIEDALLSLLDQSHQNWECIIVDDCSESQHRDKLTQIVDSINCDKIEILSLEQNVGQTLAFFKGLERTSGEFVCLLDPDDRYAETFLEEAINAHLNNTIICPIVCTDQFILNKKGIIAGTRAKHKLKNKIETLQDAYLIDDNFSPLLYFHTETKGWLWTSTSSMMFRRAAIKYLRPHKMLSYKAGADAYLAIGAHSLGGTLFVTKPLVYRTLHDSNVFANQEIFSTFQAKGKSGANNWGRQCIIDIQEALIKNDAPNILSWRANSKHKRLLKWKRSFIKRWMKLRGLIGYPIKK